MSCTKAPFHINSASSLSSFNSILTVSSFSLRNFPNQFSIPMESTQEIISNYLGRAHDFDLDSLADPLDDPFDAVEAPLLSPPTPVERAPLTQLPLVAKGLAAKETAGRALPRNQPLETFSLWDDMSWRDTHRRVDGAAVPSLKEFERYLALLASSTDKLVRQLGEVRAKNRELEARAAQLEAECARARESQGELALLRVELAQSQEECSRHAQVERANKLLVRENNLLREKLAKYKALYDEVKLQAQQGLPQKQSLYNQIPQHLHQQQNQVPLQQNQVPQNQVPQNQTLHNQIPPFQASQGVQIPHGQIPQGQIPQGQIPQNVQLPQSVQIPHGVQIPQVPQNEPQTLHNPNPPAPTYHEPHRSAPATVPSNADQPAAGQPQSTQSQSQRQPAAGQPQSTQSQSQPQPGLSGLSGQSQPDLSRQSQPGLSGLGPDLAALLRSLQTPELLQLAGYVAQISLEMQKVNLTLARTCCHSKPPCSACSSASASRGMDHSSPVAELGPTETLMGKYPWNRTV